jgi:hypothetical protein
MPIVIRLCNRLAELLSPQSDNNSPCHVNENEAKDCQGQWKIVEITRENDADQDTFSNSWHHPEKKIFHQSITRQDTSVHGPNNFT